jgi:membrane protease YdiL (CAAX protease family)
MAEDKGTKGDDKGRKNGSILVALIAGIGVGGIGIYTLYAGVTPDKREYLTNGGTSIVFALIMLWWVFSREKPREPGFRWQAFYEERNWGIGFETVTMVVTVVTALVAIFTLTHELYK